MTNYRVNTFDVCTSGFERLRSNSEFIILACVTANVTYNELREELLGDVSSCDRGDEFDYVQCISDLGAWLDETVKPAFDRSANPFDLETPPEDCDDWNYCNVYLYVEAVEHEPASA